MRHPVNRELFAYWERLRGGRSAPERSDIDPAAIRNLLPFTFILESEASGSGAASAVSFRLSGTRINALFRRELKGALFADIWAASHRAEAAALVEGVLDGRAPAVAGLRGSPADYPRVDFELLLLPLRHYGRTHARLFGSLVAGAVPSWIGLKAAEGLELASFRSILPSGASRLGQFGAGGRGADAEPPRAAVPSLPAASGRPTLRLYQGGLAVAGRKVTASDRDAC